MLRKLKPRASAARAVMLACACLVHDAVEVQSGGAALLLLD
jgi:hypothetical protein